MSCDTAGLGLTSLEVCLDAGGDPPNGDCVRGVGDAVRSMAPETGDPGRGGRGIEGGGVGSVMGPDLRCWEDEEP